MCLFSFSALIIYDTREINYVVGGIVKQIDLPLIAITFAENAMAEDAKASAPKKLVYF